MEPSLRNELYVPEPAMPVAFGDATWLDTDPGAEMWRGLDVTQLPDMDGFIGELFFDQDVTLFVETASSFTGTLQAMNNGGDGDVIPANTPITVRIGFLGRRTHLRLRMGGTLPTVFHANGKLIKGDLGGPGDNTIAYGVTLHSPGPTGDEGPTGPTGPQTPNTLFISRALPADGQGLFNTIPVVMPACTLGHARMRLHLNGAADMGGQELKLRIINESGGSPSSVTSSLIPDSDAEGNFTVDLDASALIFANGNLLNAHLISTAMEITLAGEINLAVDFTRT